MTFAVSLLSRWGCDLSHVFFFCIVHYAMSLLPCWHCDLSHVFIFSFPRFCWISIAIFFPFAGSAYISLIKFAFVALVLWFRIRAFLVFSFLCVAFFSVTDTSCFPQHWFFSFSSRHYLKEWDSVSDIFLYGLWLERDFLFYFSVISDCPQFLSFCLIADDLWSAVANKIVHCMWFLILQCLTHYILEEIFSVASDFFFASFSHWSNVLNDINQ